MTKRRKKLISVDFQNIEHGKHLSEFETVIREMLCAKNDWNALFFWMDMDAALNTLTERQRLCFSLKYISGYSEVEIAEMLQISQPAVFVHARLGKSKVKYFLSDGYKNT